MLEPNATKKEKKVLKYCIHTHNPDFEKLTKKNKTI